MFSFLFSFLNRTKNLTLDLSPSPFQKKNEQERLVAELAALGELEVAGTKEQVAARLLEALAARRKAGNGSSSSSGGGGVEYGDEEAMKKAAAKEETPASAEASSKSNKLSKAGRRAAVLASEPPRRAAAAAAASSSSSSSSPSHALPPGAFVASPRALERLPKSVLVASVVARGISPDERAAAALTKQRLASLMFEALEAEAAELEFEEEFEEGPEREAEEREYAAELARWVRVRVRVRRAALLSVSGDAGRRVCFGVRFLTSFAPLPLPL